MGFFSRFFSRTKSEKNDEEVVGTRIGSHYVASTVTTDNSVSSYAEMLHNTMERQRNPLGEVVQVNRQEILNRVYTISMIYGLPIQDVMFMFHRVSYTTPDDEIARMVMSERISRYEDGTINTTYNNSGYQTIDYNNPYASSIGTYTIPAHLVQEMPMSSPSDHIYYIKPIHVGEMYKKKPKFKQEEMEL